MSTQKRISLQSAFQLDDEEFGDLFVLRYLQEAENHKATEEQLENAVRWGRQAMTDALLLEGFLDGTLRLHCDDGQISFQLMTEDSDHSSVGNR